LENDPKADTQNLHSQITALINDLNNHIHNNILKVSEIEKFLLPYYNHDNNTNKENSVVALIFNNKKFYRNFSELAKTSLKWNKALQLYFQLLKSESPEDIEITSIHNGSFDIIFNIDVNIAIDLAEIVKYGLIALGGYLMYCLSRTCRFSGKHIRWFKA
jgi:hypothetical protein